MTPAKQVFGKSGKVEKDIKSGYEVGRSGYKVGKVDKDEPAAGKCPQLTQQQQSVERVMGGLLADVAREE